MTVRVDGRSLCADDLVYGFGYRNRDAQFEAPVYTLNYDTKAALFQKVFYKGRRVWTGYEVTA